VNAYPSPLRRKFRTAALGALFLQVACAGARPAPVAVPGADHVHTYPGQEAGTVGHVHRVIVPQDLLEVTVFGSEELSRAVRVTDVGEISLPLIGAITAAGHTPRALEASLVARLRVYVRDPHVTVEVKEAAAQPVYVLGEVNQPGAFTSAGQQPMTILRAISVARGTKPTASPRRMVVIRTTASGERVQMPVNLNDVVRGKAPDMTLLPNDVIYIPKNNERAIALGVIDTMVRLVTFRAVF
jgi:polysaccharide biosynthesis/export protein